MQEEEKFLWTFVLYVAGEDRKSLDAIEKLKEVCDKHLANRCKIEVIDLKKFPDLAAKEGIFATPTLKIRLPPSIKSIIGDLTNIDKVLVELDIPLKK